MTVAETAHENVHSHLLIRYNVSKRKEVKQMTIEDTVAKDELSLKARQRGCHPGIP